MIECRGIEQYCTTICAEIGKHGACPTFVTIHFVEHHVKWTLFFQRLIWIYNLDVDASISCPGQEGALQMLLSLQDMQTFQSFEAQSLEA